MKLLICGDIHGNLPALEIMLAKEKGNFDQLVCHGDVVNYGPWSNECVEVLASVSENIILQGNHEEYYLKGEYPGQNSIAKTFFEFCFPFFTKFEQITKYQQEFEFGEFNIRHSINNEYMFKDSEINSIDGNYIIGHSHQQFDRTIGQYRLINTGSVGQNRSTINVINYLICELDKNLVEMNYIKYDHQVIINEMIARAYPAICIDYYKNKSII